MGNSLREWVWEALCKVILDNAYSNLYLKDHLSELPPKDQALASRIFYGTLQNYGYCEAVWKRFTDNKVSPRLRVLLTFSVYQMLFLDKVPDYAVIDQAVTLAGKISPKLRGFVNAVLRKVQKTPYELPADEWKALAIKTSLPEWLIRMWVAHYGADKARQIALSTTIEQPVYVRVNPLCMTMPDLKKAIQDGRLEEDESGLYIWKGGSLPADPLYTEGKISAMDPGSYEIALFTQPEMDEKVLDVCAAPGTKTMTIAEEMDDEGEIIACDIHPHRVRLIKNDAERLHLDSIQAVSHDSTTPYNNGERFDLVLADVPCSGFGVLSRKPDMKLKLSPNSMDTLIPVQAKILNAAAGNVKKGGRLVYSTCTLNRKENENQVEEFLKNHPDFYLDDMQTIFADASHDGFFMARMIREGQEEPEEITVEEAEGKPESAQPVPMDSEPEGAAPISSENQPAEPAEEVNPGGN